MVIDKGNYKLYKEDCLKVIEKIPNKAIDCIITDAPYLHERGRKNGLLKSEALDVQGFNIKTLGDFGKEKIYEFLDSTKRIMKKKKWFIFCSEKQIPYYTSWAVENNLKFNVLVWCKPNGVTDRRRYSTNLEYIIRIYSNGCSLNKLNFEEYPYKVAYYSKWKTHKRIPGKQKHHPSQKPIDLISELIELNTNEDDVILDPYMGSGSTGVAALKINRRFVGCEIESKYFDIACKRLEEVVVE